MPIQRLVSVDHDGNKVTLDAHTIWRPFYGFLIKAAWWGPVKPPRGHKKKAKKSERATMTPGVRIKKTPR
jgi:hypothetical protein